MTIEGMKVNDEVLTPYGRGNITRLNADGSFTIRVDMDPEFLIWHAGSSGRYAALSAILDEAITRASEGKGKDRHANGNPFDEQPIVALNLTLSSQDGPLFQIQKKCAEASRFYAAGERERAENELLDCIVYAAGAVITGRKRE